MVAYTDRQTDTHVCYEQNKSVEDIKSMLYSTGDTISRGCTTQNRVTCYPDICEMCVE